MAHHPHALTAESLAALAAPIYAALIQQYAEAGMGKHSAIVAEALWRAWDLHLVADEYCEGKKHPAKEA